VVTITQFNPEQITIQTETVVPSLLVLTEAFYPGWQATIDGYPTEIFQADVYFQALFVPEGEHEIVFTFQPKSFGYGRIVTIIGLIIVVFLTITLFISYRRINV